MSYHSKSDPVLMIVLDTSAKLLRELVSRNVLKQLCRCPFECVLKKIKKN